MTEVGEAIQRICIVSIHLLMMLLLGACGSQEQPIVFPNHNEPLSTMWAHHDYISGVLGVENGCLRMLGPSPTYLLVWPDDFTLGSPARPPAILDPDETIRVTVGDEVRFSGRVVTDRSDLAREIAASIPEKCQGPYYLVGDDVTVIDAKEPEEVTALGTALFFPRHQTWRNKPHLVADTLERHSRPFELVLDGNCLVVSDGQEYVVRWPPGYYPLVNEDGVVEVRNGGGRTIARTGDRLRFRGGRIYDVEIPECDASAMWRVKDIRNADLPPVFTRHQDPSRPFADSRIDGHIGIHNGCFYMRKYILVWPSDFSMEVPDHKVRILNELGQVVVQIDREAGGDTSHDRLTLKGREVGDGDNLGRQTRRELPIDCPHGPFWFVN